MSWNAAILPLCCTFAVIIVSWLAYSDNFIVRSAKLSLLTPSPLRLYISVISESLPFRSKFTVDDIPDLTGKVMMVTGGNRGVGFEIIKVSNGLSLQTTC